MVTDQREADLPRKESTGMVKGPRHATEGWRNRGLQEWGMEGGGIATHAAELFASRGSSDGREGNPKTPFDSKFEVL